METQSLWLQVVPQTPAGWKVQVLARMEEQRDESAGCLRFSEVTFRDTAYILLIVIRKAASVTLEFSVSRPGAELSTTEQARDLQFLEPSAVGTVWGHGGN